MSISAQNSLGHINEGTEHSQQALTLPRPHQGPTHCMTPPSTWPHPLQDSTLYMAPPSTGLQPKIIKAI